MISVDHVQKCTPTGGQVPRRTPPLSRRARACLLAARDLADSSGEVRGGQRALAATLGIVDLSNVRRALAELEDRGLADRRDRDRVILGPQVRAKMHVVDEQIAPPPMQARARGDHERRRTQMRTKADAYYPGGTADPDFRWLRAKIGGLERANADFKRQRDEARGLLAKLEARADGGGAAAIALRADLVHAADCGDPDCAACLRMIEQLEDPDGPYLAVVGGRS